MNIQEIIAKKRDGLVLNKEEINYFISEYTKGNPEKIANQGTFQHQHTFSWRTGYRHADYGCIGNP